MQSLEKIVEQSFLDYSAYVIQRRAIPDARDMMKYTGRQILHAQHREKLDAAHGFKKSLKSVAAATGFSYVHGNASAYEQIIRFGRPLVQRYFFEEINGNGGTPMNSSDYSADRYTEARLSQLAMRLFEYIEMDTIPNDWEPTYDEEGVFPKVLPSVGYYNICNGSFGSIAPTMISSVPQFNLREINEAIICLIKDPNFDPEIYPDFASGGILLNPKTTLSSLRAGEGKSALIRGKVRVDLKEKCIEITELPYGVYTNTVCEEIADAIDKGDCPATSFKDLSKRSVNIRVYGKDLVALEQWLYKNTSVQKHFTIKMIMLDEGKTPKLFSLKECLLAHISHVKSVWRRMLEYKLGELKSREEIINGLLKAYSILDDVIASIKASSGRTDAIRVLMSEYEFTEPQAKAIVDLRLHKLSSIDIEMLKKELEENLKEQNDIAETLTLAGKFNKQLIDQYEDVAKRFGDNRRTEICQSDAWEAGQDGSKAVKDFWFLKTGNSYIAAYNESGEYKNKVFDTRIRLDDDVILFTSQARAFIRKGSEFLMGRVDFADIVKLNPDEKVLFVIRSEDLGQFNFIEVQDDQGNMWSIHNSFIALGASKRGKKVVTGKYKLTDYRLQKSVTQHPKLR